MVTTDNQDPKLGVIVCRALALSLRDKIPTGRVMVTVRICTVTPSEGTRISFPVAASLLMSVWPWHGRRQSWQSEVTCLGQGHLKTKKTGADSLEVGTWQETPAESRGRLVRATVQVTLGPGEEQSSNQDQWLQAEAAPKDSWRWSAGPQPGALEHSNEARNTALPGGSATCRKEWLGHRELGPVGRKCRCGWFLCIRSLIHSFGQPV